MAALTPPAAVAPDPGAPPGRVVEGTYGEGAAARRYTLYVPQGRPRANAVGVPEKPGRPALIVFLHGCTQDAADARRGTGLDAEAERVTAAVHTAVLVLYPEQSPAANAQRCWNWFDPAHQARDAGELATIAGMTRAVAAEHGVDPRRVHVAGMSAGGAMALLLAAHYPDLYARAESHSGVPVGAAASAAEAWRAMRGGAAADPGPVRRAMGARARVVPLLVVHGTADGVVSAKNGEATAEQWAAAAGARADGGGAARAADLATGARAWRSRTWSLGSSLAPDRVPVVELVEVDGLGHAWSGGSRAGTFTDPAPPSAAEWVVGWLWNHPAGVVPDRP